MHMHISYEYIRKFVYCLVFLSVSVYSALRKPTRQPKPFWVSLLLLLKWNFQPPILYDEFPSLLAVNCRESDVCQIIYLMRFTCVRCGQSTQLLSWTELSQLGALITLSSQLIIQLVLKMFRISQLTSNSLKFIITTVLNCNCPISSMATVNKNSL